MSYVGNASDVEQEKDINEFHQNPDTSSLSPKAMASQKVKEGLWNSKRPDDDTDSEISEGENFLAKGAFLLTPSHELSMERAAIICEKMNFKGCFSLTKTATGILFKFSHPEDYQSVFKKGFHKVTNARFYRKVSIPCRPQKTFTLYVLDVPEDLPIEDIRHSLYKFNSVVEVVRIIIHPQSSVTAEKSADGATTPTPPPVHSSKENPPPPIRITLASVDEHNILLQNGLDFYGATFFPTEANINLGNAKIQVKKGCYRQMDGTIAGRVRELLPVFDAAGFVKIAPPASKIIKPRPI